ncbi:MAG: cold shock domain-containing protein [Anaerolineales bacterium]|nr:cold shock domain-containing protein [Anaerolineales bacterium]MCA9928900.1 cold shock domain-containing protein [Anaerolineales bacterium]
MNYRDRWATNEQGEKFLFTVEMQRKLDRAGLPVEPASLSQLAEATPQYDRGSQPNYRNNQERSFRERDEPERGHQDNELDSPASGQDEPASEIEEPLTIQIDPQTGKYIGRMKWYNLKKGYGFIIRGAGEEIFFHKSGTVGEPTELKEGQWILYDVEETHKGPEATEVEPYDGNPDLLG